MAVSRLGSFLGSCRYGEDVLSFSMLLTVEKLKAVELGFFYLHLYPDEKAHLSSLCTNLTDNFYNVLKNILQYQDKAKIKHEDS